MARALARNRLQNASLGARDRLSTRQICAAQRLSPDATAPPNSL